MEYGGFVVLAIDNYSGCVREHDHLPNEMAARRLADEWRDTCSVIEIYDTSDALVCVWSNT